MKKRWFLIFFVLLLFFVSVGCNAQSINTEQRLIGSWVSERTGSIMVLNADGTGSFGGRNFKYGLAEGKLARIFDNDESAAYIADYFISSDGRTLILSFFGSDRGELFRKRN